MGKIKSTLIKKTAKQLLNEENCFSSDFEVNKKLLSVGMPSKKNRNKIAGYIAKIKRKESREKAVPSSKQI